jgi:hypothetical protein
VTYAASNHEFGIPPCIHSDVAAKQTGIIMTKELFLGESIKEFLKQPQLQE